MREGLKTDELVAIILAIIGVIITPIATANTVLPANHPSNMLVILGQLAIGYLFICVAARKFDDIQQKYHRTDKSKRD
jgi:hypothetical protein